MKLYSRIRRIQLQIEGRRLDGLLLVIRQLREAIGEGTCDAEVHSAQKQMRDSKEIEAGCRSMRLVRRCLGPPQSPGAPACTVGDIRSRTTFPHRPRSE